jgi:hypothetical protein
MWPPMAGRLDWRPMIAAVVTVRLVSEDARSFTLSCVVREPSAAGGESEGWSETKHQVTLTRDLLAHLAPGEQAESFVRRCFEFLLEREPKESILRIFDVGVIGRYFPEFEKTIAKP